MPNYKVKWEIEVDAENAYRAAEMALEIQSVAIAFRRLSATFKVKKEGKGQKTYEIDLGKDMVGE